MEALIVALQRDKRSIDVTIISQAITNYYLNILQYIRNRGFKRIQCYARPLYLARERVHISGYKVPKNIENTEADVDEVVDFHSFNVSIIYLEQSTEDDRGTHEPIKVALDLKTGEVFQRFSIKDKTKTPSLFREVNDYWAVTYPIELYLTKAALTALKCSSHSMAILPWELLHYYYIILV